MSRAPIDPSRVASDPAYARRVLAEAGAPYAEPAEPCADLRTALERLATEAAAVPHLDR